ncbi:hypothetical protein BEL04_18615 [Mucilaginibacter sp. PPCGB 2223]|nr:hypothetical protein BEL04_18615 [Mucilaginibacter sp. PPCGB 2223]
MLLHLLLMLSPAIHNSWVNMGIIKFILFNPSDIQSLNRGVVRNFQWFILIIQKFSPALHLQLNIPNFSFKNKIYRQ